MTNYVSSLQSYCEDEMKDSRHGESHIPPILYGSDLYVRCSKRFSKMYK